MSSTGRYLDIMTCRASHGNSGSGATSSFLSSPLYLSDMSHVDVKLESAEQVAPESAFYLTGKKSVNVVQKLDDAIKSREIQSHRRRVELDSFSRTFPRSFSAPSLPRREQHESYVRERSQIRLDRIESMRYPPKPKPVLVHTRMCTAESRELLRTTRVNENKLLSLQT